MNAPPSPDPSDPADASATASGQFDLALLGTFRLTADGRVVVLHEREQRVLALLAVRDRTMGRSALAGILWPDASDANALSSLRSALSRLPDDLREQLTVTPRELTLSPEVSVDLRRARLLAQQLLAPTSALPEANNGLPSVVLLSADLLPDWYEDWVVEESRQWHSLRARALESWSVRLLAMGRFGEAVEAAIAAIDAEPLGESGYAALIRAYLAQGDRAAARRVLADYQRTSGADRDAPPPEQLNALFEASELTVPDQSTESVLRRARTAVAGEETEAFEVIASGISMEPSIRHGDTLVVSQQVAPAAGRVVVAIHNGAWIVKRLALRDGELVLRSDNVDEEVPLNAVEMQGVVVQLHRNL
jgi:DNA-binding SARP family transcriptional activator